MPLDHKKIRELREAKHQSQDAAAQNARMKQQAWARIESGKNSNVLLQTAEAIAQALDVSVDAILEK